MGFFDKLQKPGHNALKLEKPVVHTETVKAKVAPTVSPFMHNRPPIVRKILKKEVKSRKDTTPKSSRASTPRPRKRASETPQRFESDTDGGDASDEDLLGSRKRMRMNDQIEVDEKRQIRSRRAFSDTEDGEFPMVHASDIATLSKLTKFSPAFPSHPEADKIALQYPSSSQREMYELVVPTQNDDFKALEDIREVMETIIGNYLPDAEATALTNDSTGLLRRVKRAVDRLAGSEYMDLIQEWNDTLVEYRQSGRLSQTMDAWKAVDLGLLERILIQTYSRTVSLRVHELRHYQNGTDNVYGELLPKFVSKILKQDTKIKSDQVFIDLGSGVGNCVLQAALEAGCESWGCEMMETACDLAELQAKEFGARCRLWGLSKGDVHLERGDFMKNLNVRKVLQRADVILVNNQAFTPSLNEDLTNLFLDLKDGAMIVSLKSFVPSGHNEARNSGATYNILDVVEKWYYSACVSWTDAAGTYYMSVKDSSRVKHFA